MGDEVDVGLSVFPPRRECDQATRGCRCPLHVSWSVSISCQFPGHLHSTVSIHTPYRRVFTFCWNGLPQATSRRSISLRRGSMIPGLGLLASIAPSAIQEPGQLAIDALVSVVNRAVGVGSRLVLDGLLKTGAAKPPDRENGAPHRQIRSNSRRAKSRTTFEVGALGGLPYV